MVVGSNRTPTNFISTTKKPYLSCEYDNGIRSHNTRNECYFSLRNEWFHYAFRNEFN